MPKLKLHYYALLREQAGRASESLDTAARTPRALYDELSARHRFRLPASQLKVAVNDAFSDWDAPLDDGDEVVFIPPVAGG
jgi:molybdopterin synthase sulfur carrier subunit/molybdopterin-guanine dinucleotide biosynthesis protein A